MQNPILTNLVTSSPPAARVAKAKGEPVSAPAAVPEAVAAPEVRSPVSEAQLAGAVKRLSDFVQVAHRDLEFTIDENSGRTIITVTDSETGEVVRQIPSEEVMAIAENIEEMRGGLLKAKA